MPSKQQDVAKDLKISPVLFLTVDGEPMSFFLRPGPVKRKLQPLITAGGGILCNVQQPGAILLIDPEDRGSVPETTAHWYVSTQYIHDCIETDEQLNAEDYRLSPEVVPRHSARLNNNKESSHGLLEGRVAYTPEDDAAILSYVSKRKAEIGGNRLWQEMGKQRVTSHSWQSMKYRYRVRLAKGQSEAEEAAPTEKDAEAAEGDTKMGDQPIPAESTQLETVEAQTSASPRGEVQHVSPQADEQPDESTQVETVDAPQPEGPGLDPQTDAHPVPAESAEPEPDEPQAIVSPPKESVPEDSPTAQPEDSLTAQPEDSSTAQPESLPGASSQKKPKEKQKASPKQEQLQRRSARRQLQLEELLSSPEPCGKKLRSSSSSAEQPSSSPQPSKKTKSAVKSALQRDAVVHEPPSKRARGKSAAAEVAESQPEESGQATVSETAQAGAELNSVPQKGEKKKEKRKLGILELATKEFEDESESDEDETPDLQNPTKTATVQPASSGPPLPTSDTAAGTVSPQSNPEQGPSLQEVVQETQVGLPETGGPGPTAAKPAAPESAAPQPVAPEPAALESAAPQPAAPEPAAPKPAAPEPAALESAAPEAVEATSKAHLFIFDSESQEEDSQSLISDNTVAPAKPQPTVNNDATFSLTQVQLEEDKQQIRELMNQTNQDLVSVTKALLKTSGDFSAARDLLLNPSGVSGPLWDRRDDGLLLSADLVVRRQLQEKYGEEDVAKRVVYLEVEG